MPAPDWRADIAGLRGLAVLLVVAYHLQWRGAGGGYIGVDVFFVISGYLMTRIVWGGLERGTFDYGRYLAARAVRIWPALGAMVAVLLALGAWWLPPFDVDALAQQSLRAVAFWSNQFFLDRSGYDIRTADTNWLLHTWSLSVEWQFYLLYPLVLVAIARWSRRRSVALISVLVLAGLSLAGHLWWSATAPEQAFFLLPARAWELLAGGAAWLVVPREGAVRRPWLGTVGVALILAAALWLALRRVPAVGAGWLLVPAVLGAVMVMASHDGHNRLLGASPLQWLGRWSYSIYLWHWPLIVGLRMTDAFLDHPRLAAGGVAVLSVLCGALSYRWVEAPAGRARTARMLRPTLALAMAGGLAVAMGAMAGRAPRAGEPPAWQAYRDSVRALYYPERCSNFMKTAAATQVCRVDKSTLPRILVIGDSHAEHLYPWFVAHSEVSVDFFTQAECPPVPHFERMQAGFHCRDYAEAAWKHAQSGSYDTLVVAAYWPNIGLDGAPYCHQLPGEAACVQFPLAQKQARVRAELRAAITALAQRGKTVVVVAPTPEARVRVPERIERERHWYGQVRLRIDERVIAERSGWLTPLFDELRGMERVHVVSFNPALCRMGTCEVYDAALQRPVFVDESHFDPVWIARHGGALAPFAQAR